MANKTNKASVDNTADASKTNNGLETTTTDVVVTKDQKPKLSIEEELAAAQEFNASLKDELAAVKLTPETLEEHDALVDKLEADLKEAIKGKNNAYREAEKTALAEADKNDNRPVFKDDRGLSWRFKQSAPKTLNIDGRPTKLEDLVENKEVMLELIYGNSNFVEQKHI